MRLGIGRVRSTQPLKYATFASLCKEEGGLSDLAPQTLELRAQNVLRHPVTSAHVPSCASSRSNARTSRSVRTVIDRSPDSIRV